MRLFLVLLAATAARGELTCIACRPGFFLDQEDVVCRRCPVNSSTFENSNATAATDCVCSPGFFNGSIACESCTFGTYKSELLNSTCTTCMPHANTTDPSSASASDCLCVPGFTVVPHYNPALETCALCAAGSFKGWLGDEACAGCPVDFFCPAGSLQPQACPAHSVAGYASESVYDCTCVQGYRHLYKHSDPPSLLCVPCEPGTFADTLNTTACNPCPQATYFNRTTAVSESDCVACPDHAASVEGSVNITDCYCVLGYAGDPGSECVACSPGKFRSDGGEYICESCPSDTYNVLAASTGPQDCKRCVQGKASAPGSDAEIDCVCNPGTFATLSVDGLSWDCQACPTGTFQEAANASSCEACAIGTASAASAANASSTCTQCDDGYNALQSATTSCSQCVAGKWQDLNDPDRHSQPCRACPGNSTHALLASTDIHDCVCLDGFVKFSSAETPNRCDECRPGAFCPGNGTQVACAYNYWSPGGVFPGPCVQCAPLSTAINDGSTVGRHQCQCVPGTEGLYDSDCVLCARGKFQPENYTFPDGADFVPGGASATPTACRPCPVGTYSDAEGAYACSPCPAHSNSSANSDDITACGCVPAYYGPYGGTCEQCPANSFCPGGVAATQCRPHSSSPTLSIAEPDCKCDPGYYSTPEELTCRKCPVGSFCHGDQHVAACPSNSSTLAGASSVDACSCMPGMWRGCILTHTGEHLDANGQSCTMDWHGGCEPCGANDICLNNTLLHCPEHSTAPPGSGDEHDCVCDDGFYNLFDHDPTTHEHAIQYEHT